MEIAQVKEYYDSLASSYDEHRVIPVMEREMIAEFSSMLETRGLRAIFDFGCGSGTIAEMLACKGFTVEAIDFSEKMIAVARLKHSHLNINYVESSFSAYLEQWNPHSAAGIVLSYSFVHTPHAEVERTLARLNDLTYLPSLVFIALHVGPVVSSISSLNNQKVTLTAWDVTNLRNTLERVGFKVLQTKLRRPESWEFDNQKICLICECGSR